jgi:hypothetical protein
MVLIACMVSSGPWAGSWEAASDAKAAARLSDLAQKSETRAAVAAMIAALVDELACVPSAEHLARKMSIAVAAAAAERCRHRAMIAWTAGRLPCDALVKALVMHVCSEPLIATSFARSCSTESVSSDGNDNIERLLRVTSRGTVFAQPDIDAAREERFLATADLRNGVVPWGFTIRNAFATFPLPRFLSTSVDPTTDQESILRAGALVASRRPGRRRSASLPEPVPCHHGVPS